MPRGGFYTRAFEQIRIPSLCPAARRDIQVIVRFRSDDDDDEADRISRYYDDGKRK